MEEEDVVNARVPLRRTRRRLDLADIVDNGERVEKLVQPLSRMFAGVYDIFRWKDQSRTLAVYSALCFTSFFSLWPIVVFVLVCALFAHGYASRTVTGDHSGYVEPSKSDKREATKNTDEYNADILNRYFNLIFEFQDSSTTLVNAVRPVHDLVFWADSAATKRVLAVFVGVSVFCLVLPAWASELVLVNVVFGLCCPLSTGLVQRVFLPQSKSSQAADGSALSSQPHSPRDLLPSIGTEDHSPVDSDLDERDLVKLEAPVSAVDSRRSASPLPGKATAGSSSSSLRQRASTGKCMSCASSFSLIKKRQYCRHCGASFCSRCCRYKVPRAVFGATAPAAAKETVRVCLDCHKALSSHVDDRM
eukprot:m.175283 g.175283  ORF g.175283 m.175283 type:complete len:362 (+) comp17344_c0_seq2:2824-3909(+)